MVKIKYKKLVEDAFIPRRANKTDAGFDIRVVRRAFIKPLAVVKVPIGLSVEVPEGYELQIRGKSGVALNKGLTVAQGIGTIDAGYRGEICVLLKNMQCFTKVIDVGEMIAQLVLNKLPEVEWQEVDKLGPSERNTDGFGDASKKVIEKENQEKDGKKT